MGSHVQPTTLPSRYYYYYYYDVQATIYRQCFLRYQCIQIGKFRGGRQQVEEKHADKHRLPPHRRARRGAGGGARGRDREAGDGGDPGVSDEELESDPFVFDAIVDG